jgi:hypothetical protein
MGMCVWSAYEGSSSCTVVTQVLLCVYVLGGSWFEADLGKSMRPSLRRTKQTGWEHGPSSTERA